MEPLAATLREAQARFADEVASIRPDLHRYCSRMTGSVLDGEDVVQEVLAQAFYGLSLIREETPLRQWLFAIAHHRCIDFLRSRRVRRAVDIDEEPYEAAMSTGAELEDHDRASRVFSSLVLSLPLRQRAAVILKDVLGYELSEIAEILGVSVGAVKSALHRARECLASLPEEPQPRGTPPSDMALRYIDAFNRRDWTALEGMVEREVTCEVVGVAQVVGRGALAAKYFGTYAARWYPWRLVPGIVDGEPVAICLGKDGEQSTPRYAIRLSWRNGNVARIRDYAHVPYLFGDGGVVVVTEEQEGNSRT